MFPELAQPISYLRKQRTNILEKATKRKKIEKELNVHIWHCPKSLKKYKFESETEESNSPYIIHLNHMLLMIMEIW